MKVGIIKHYPGTGDINWDYSRQNSTYDYYLTYNRLLLNLVQLFPELSVTILHCWNGLKELMCQTTLRNNLDSVHQAPHEQIFIIAYCLLHLDVQIFPSSYECFYTSRCLGIPTVGTN